MTLHIVFRSCSRQHVHFEQRFIPVDKAMLISQCLKSLVLSLARAPQNLRFRLTVVDDHSSDACVGDIKAILARAKFATEFIPLEETGNNPSLKYCFNMARTSDAELIYLVEDDYLHSLECMDEMLDAYFYFGQKLSANIQNPEVAIMPVDNMFHYHDNTMFSSPLVLGRNRHWRVNYYSNATFLISRKAIANNWRTFEQLSDYQLSRPETHEDATLGPMFRTTVNLFTPVPTLALHVAGHTYESPYSNWRKLWSDIAAAWDAFPGIALPRETPAPPL
jgi:hypothetical protein